MKQSDTIFIKTSVYVIRFRIFLKWISVECIIRNSSLPLLGGRNMTREDKEKHSFFLNFYSINVSEKVLISNKKNTLSISIKRTNKCQRRDFPQRRVFQQNMDNFVEFRMIRCELRAVN